MQFRKMVKSGDLNSQLRTRTRVIFLSSDVMIPTLHFRSNKRNDGTHQLVLMRELVSWVSCIYIYSSSMHIIHGRWVRIVGSSNLLTDTKLSGGSL